MIVERFCNTPISLEEAVEEHFDGFPNTTPGSDTRLEDTIEKCNKLQKVLVKLLTSDGLNLNLHDINEILETNFKEL